MFLLFACMKHLALLLHGLNGSTSELLYLANQLKSRHEDKSVVFQIPDCNYGKTGDGILQGSQRIYEYIIQELTRDKYSYISFIGHSLGGIYARCVIGKLFEHGIIPTKLKPINLITLATPHLGAREHVHIGDYLTGFLVRHLVGRTVLELTMTDNVHDECFMMSLVGDYYITPLKLFENLVVYANVKSDITVNYVTGAIRKTNFRNTSSGETIVCDDRVEDGKLLKAQDKMHMVLNKLPWKRYAVIPARVLFAHTDIIVRSEYWDKKYGSHVIIHLVDQFRNK